MFFGYINKILNLSVNRHALILGDSHANVFYNLIPLFNDYHFNTTITSVEGATISGFSNPNSITNSHQIFKAALSIRKWNLIILLIGEVDIGFIIWYRQLKYKEPVDQFFEIVIRNYFLFIDNNIDKSKLICVSIPLPTIQDGEACGIVANQRSIIDVPQILRTKKTLEFNKRLKKHCNERGILFIDLDNKSIGNNGLIKPTLLNHNTTDHHYDSKMYSKLLIPEFENILIKYNSR